jgi:hypothetical protein
LKPRIFGVPQIFGLEGVLNHGNLLGNQGIYHPVIITALYTTFPFDRIPGNV